MTVVQNPVTMDAGYAWVILFACSSIYVVMSGMAKAFGILYTELILEFDTGAGSTAWIGSVMMFLFFGLGPVSNRLAERFTFRKVIIVGGFLTSLGHFLSAFVPRMEWMYLTIGVIAGSGCGFVFAPSTTIISFYFEKRRAMALGVVLAGAGLGSVVYPYFYRIILDSFGLRTSLIIVSGVLMYVPFVALLLREPAQLMNKRCEQLKDDNCCCENQNKVKALNKSSLTYTTETHNDYDEITKSPEQTIPNSNGIRTITYAPKAHQGDTSINHVLNSKNSTLRGNPNDQANNNTLRGNPNDHANNSTLRGNPNDQGNNSTLRTNPNDQANQDKRNDNNMRGRNEIENDRRSCFSMFDFTLFRIPKFTMYVLAFSLNILGYGGNFTAFPSYIMEVGYQKDEVAVAMSIIGATEVLARPFFGWFADLKLLSVKNILIFSAIISGIAAILLPLWDSYEIMLVYAVVVGTFPGAFWSLMAVAMLESVNLDKLTRAMGLLSLFMAFGMVLSQPLAGWLKDVTGTWNLSFRIIGMFVSIAGLVVIAEPMFHRVWKHFTPELQLKASCDTDIEVTIDQTTESVSDSLTHGVVSQRNDSTTNCTDTVYIIPTSKATYL